MMKKRRPLTVTETQKRKLSVAHANAASVLQEIRNSPAFVLLPASSLYMLADAVSRLAVLESLPITEQKVCAICGAVWPCPQGHTFSRKEDCNG